MHFSELIKKIENKKFGPVYLLTGEESYLQICAQDSFKRSVITEGVEDFDLEYLDGMSFSFEAYINAVRSLPLMSERKLIIFKNFHAVNTKSMKSVTDNLSGNLDRIILLLIYEKKPDFKAKSPLGEIRDKFDWVDLAHPRGMEFERILKWMFQDKVLDQDLTAFLTGSGVDLWQIHNWITQTLDFLEETNRITLADVREFVDLGGTADIWAFTNTVGRKENKQAQKLLLDLIRNREKPGLILWSLKDLFIHLHVICKLRHSGKQPERYRANMNLNAYKFTNYCKFSSHFTVEEVEKALQKIQDADVKMKTTRVEPESLFLEFLNDVIN
ncbi:MAG: DNA polymerase III subunit delta [FCB group bacterium]|nr:DNA polymerase III subunit delta [FCB group bacterium]